MLENAGHGDTFSILTRPARCRSSARNHARHVAARGRSRRFLEKPHLIGALDLEKALRTALPLPEKARNPYLVHVGAGIPAMGEKRDDVLAQLIPTNVRYVGIGVGKRWNRSFMKQAAERTSGTSRTSIPMNPWPGDPSNCWPR